MEAVAPSSNWTPKSAHIKTFHHVITVSNSQNLAHTLTFSLTLACLSTVEPFKSYFLCILNFVLNTLFITKRYVSLLSTVIRYTAKYCGNSVFACFSTMYWKGIKKKF